MTGLSEWWIEKDVGEVVVVYLWHNPSILLQELRKIPVGIPDLRAENQTPDLSNTKQVCKPHNSDVRCDAMELMQQRMSP
jgi:hypothetical protein